MRQATATWTQHPWVTGTCVPALGQHGDAEAVKHIVLATLTYTSLDHPAWAPFTFLGGVILGIRIIHWWVFLPLNLTLSTYRYLLPETALKQMPKPRGYPDKNKGGILTYFRVMKPIFWCSLCAWDLFLLGVIQSSQPGNQGNYTPAVFSPL